MMSLVNEEKIEILLRADMRILKATPDRFVIGGYASVLLEDDSGNEIGDFEGDSMDLDALEEAFFRMMKIASRRNLMASHTEAQIGELLEDFTDSDGEFWKSQVIRVPTLKYKRKGLFIVAELFNDMEEARRYRKVMENDRMLALSIGGEAIRRTTVCNTGGDCFVKIVAMDLFGVSSCSAGMNKESLAFVMKGAESNQLLDSVKTGSSLLRKLRER